MGHGAPGRSCKIPPPLSTRMRRKTRSTRTPLPRRSALTPAVKMGNQLSGGIPPKSTWEILRIVVPQKNGEVFFGFPKTKGVHRVVLVSYDCQRLIALDPSWSGMKPFSPLWVTDRWVVVWRLEFASSSSLVSQVKNRIQNESKSNHIEGPKPGQPARQRR